MHRIFATVALATAVGVAGLAGSAGASGTDVCSLITKKEVSKILGAKVVKLKRETNNSTGAQVCTYKTKKFTSKHLKKFNGALGLELIWGPVTQDLRDAIAKAGSDLTAIPGLGDSAYSTQGSVLALRAADVVQASIVNWQAPLSKLSAKSEKAVRLALPRLPTG
jgi:hypothetical protein